MVRKWKMNEYDIRWEKLFLRKTFQQLVNTFQPNRQTDGHNIHRIDAHQ